MFFNNAYKINPFIEIPVFPDEKFVLMYPINGVINIKNCSYIITSRGRIFSLMNNSGEVEELHPRTDYKGYKQIGLFRNDGTRSQFQIHRLVCIYFNFIPGCEKLLVNHKNGIHDDNRIENLEWMTNQENQIHALRELHSKNYALSDITISAIQEDLNLNKLSYLDIANKYNTTMSNVRAIANDTYNKEDPIDNADKAIYEEAILIPPETVNFIYDELLNGASVKDVANRHSVSISAVAAIRDVHPAYKEILGYKQPIKNGARGVKSIDNLDEETIISIYNDKLNGESVAKLSIKHNVSENVINNIIKCKGKYCYLQYKYGLKPLYGNSNYRVYVNIDEELAQKIYDMCLTKTNKVVSEITGVSIERIMDIKQCRNAYSYLKTKYGLEPQPLYERKDYKYFKDIKEGGI